MTPQSEAEKNNKQLQHQLLEIQTRYDDAVRSLGDFESNKKKLVAENKDLLRQLEDTEKQLDIFSKLKMSLEHDLHETKIVADEQRQVSLHYNRWYNSVKYSIYQLSSVIVYARVTFNYIFLSSCTQ